MDHLAHTPSLATHFARCCIAYNVVIIHSQPCFNHRPGLLHRERADIEIARSLTRWQYSNSDAYVCMRTINVMLKQALSNGAAH